MSVDLKTSVDDLFTEYREMVESDYDFFQVATDPNEKYWPLQAAVQRIERSDRFCEDPVHSVDEIQENRISTMMVLCLGQDILTPETRQKYVRLLAVLLLNRQVDNRLLRSYAALAEYRIGTPG